jgi:hypothetical protein
MQPLAPWVSGEGDVVEHEGLEEDFPVNRDDGLKIKKVKPFSEEEDIPAMHAIQVGTDYFERWVVTIIDLDTNEITKLYELGSGGNVDH